MADKEKRETVELAAALVLPVEAAASSEPQTVAGFPGRWLPGEPVAVSALGLTEAEARSILRDRGLPLEVVRAEAPRGEFRRDLSHAPDAPVETNLVAPVAGPVVATPVAVIQGVLPAELSEAEDG